MSAEVLVALALLTALASCTACAEPVPSPSPAPARRDAEAPKRSADAPKRSADASLRPIDMHVHLVEGAVEPLIAALDRHGIGEAVVLASPHLDPSLSPNLTQSPTSLADEPDAFAGWREANTRLLDETAPHRARLWPFVTVDPAAVETPELERWFERGACGVKLYIGHRSLRRRPLDDPSHEPTWSWLEQRRAPVLVHVNTVRFADELAAVLEAHPALELVCPHLCGSRTDLDRLAALLRAHPTLRVDTSHGASKPGVDGFANLERERGRLRAMIEAAPHRFMFGSDLVTASVAGDAGATQLEWDRQLAANLGLLRAERFEYWREAERAGAVSMGSYRGLALEEALLEPLLVANARAWLAGCARSPPS